MSDYPYFSLSELQTMRGVFNSSLHYIGPVGLNAQATAQWRQHKHWLDRIDSLIAEYEECLAAIIAAKGGTCRLLESVMTNLDLRGRRGQLGPVQYHHLVPRDLGGDDVADNIIPLCDLCHRGITDRLPGHVTALLHTLSDAEYAYAVGKAGEDVWERVYGIRYSR